jgi:hypothetical protein
MKLILKDIPKIDHLFVGGEPNEMYDKRRMTIESDSYVLQGSDQDITSIENWDKYGSFICTDYLQTRNHIIDIFDWSTATDAEKDIVISYFGFDKSLDTATNDTNKVAYLMGKGMTQADAQGFLVLSYSKFHTKEKGACYQRANCEKLSIVMLSYLSIIDSRDFIETTKLLMDLYAQQGIFGTAYGVAGVGIMDYIESTPGTVYENVGLDSKGYIFNTGTLNDFKNDLKDILLNGNY